MHEQKREQRLRDGLRAVRVELEELLHTLSSDGTGAVGEGRDTQVVPVAGEAPPNFFAEITRREQAPDDELRRQVLRLITSLGYASTLVLQHRLEISYRQASSIVAALERDGMVAPAPGFRPHKTLAPAYQMLESLETQLGEPRQH
ncbi:MAG TPA: DNA translocase FtsK [Blastocatellia bacterium]|nr:DNA translocase FtsK [Blastocatellia bacterium]